MYIYIYIYIFIYMHSYMKFSYCRLVTSETVRVFETVDT